MVTPGTAPRPEGDTMNVGSGQEVTVSETVPKIERIVW